MINKRRCYIFIILFIFLTFPTIGEQLNRIDGDKPNTTPKEVLDGGITMIEIYLSFGVLVFELILILIMGFFASRKVWDQETTRAFTISIIIVAGLFLIAAGYSEKQLSPMFGLLGTIVGYLLGKSSCCIERGPKQGS